MSVVNSTSAFAFFEPLRARFSITRNRLSLRNEATLGDRPSEPVQCDILEPFGRREQTLCLASHLIPDCRARDRHPCLSPSTRKQYISLMLCLSFYERRRIHPCEQTPLARRHGARARNPRQLTAYPGPGENSMEVARLECSSRREASSGIVSRAARRPSLQQLDLSATT